MLKHNFALRWRTLAFGALAAGVITAVPTAVHADPPTDAAPAATSGPTIASAPDAADAAPAPTPTDDDATNTDDASTDDAATVVAAEATDETESEPAADDPEDATLFDVCPLGGPSTFEDSWGWARSGGRSHEGVDMIAGRGTPVIAVRDGFAQFKSNSLGGRAIWLTAPNGDKFYYAHLDNWEGESRDVAAGDLIGYVGSTGNAHGPHLHFETLPGGSVENPYPHTFRGCVPSPADVAAMANQLNDPELWNRFLPEG